MPQITTITFFKYTNWRSKIWAFLMMQFAHKALSRVKGMQFYKIMGSGREAFNPLPDWSVYAMLQVWDTEQVALEFFECSALMEQYKKHSNHHYTVFMKNIVAKGEWSGQNPFVKSEDINDVIPYIAVITRATIKFKYLKRFWNYVPASQMSLASNKGLLFTKGIGEVPISQMATFSIWSDKQALMDFAYRSEGHKIAIQKTKALDWYKEELFSRFQPYKTMGFWEGVRLEFKGDA